jgi:hypothetical protein
VLGFIPNLANTTSTPTLNVQGLGAVTIVKGTNTALNNGDLATGTIAYVAYNGTNFVLQNPQNAITQASADASSFANPNFKTGYINSSSGSTGNVSYQGGQDAGISSALGSAIVRGGTNSGTGAGGNTNIEAGANTSTGQQGFANVQQSFTIAAATTIGYVMGMTTAADRVQAAAPGSTNNVGVAASAGGTGTQLYVATDGKILTAFDGTPTVGDIACAPPASTGTAGLAHDNGATACPAGQKLGVVTGQVSGTGPGATATVLLQLGS